MRVLIGGDVVPDKGGHFGDADFLEKVDKDFLSRWLRADYRVFNLEAPICDGGLKSIEKEGPNLRANRDDMLGVSSLSPSVVCLANNHILDYGERGAKQTVDELTKCGIQCIGLGNSAGGHSIILEEGGIKLGVYNLCDTEFNQIGNSSYSANVFEGASNYREISSLKENCDFVLVIFHAGKEYFRYPTPGLRKICRSLVDFGADFVTTQHSHCVGCMEKYAGGTIVYGQGNFIFADCNNPPYTDTGIVVDLTVNKNGSRVDFVPVGKRDGVICALGDSAVVEDFKERTERIKKEGFVEEETVRFANSLADDYLGRLHHLTYCDRAKRKIFGILPKERYTRGEVLGLVNILQCDAHREVFLTALRSMLEDGYGA